ALLRTGPYWSILGCSYCNVNYTQPVVAVQFSNATSNTEHHVECRLNAAGLRADDERDKFAGRVAFRLRINRD
uniref:Sodium/potassium-transporting ATPase subunit beta-2 n=1 Tax=Phasianus colchicus TaxID=9054 RepID=A0A669QPL1_PHACC